MLSSAVWADAEAARRRAPTAIGVRMVRGNGADFMTMLFD
jgi:hypothetical protein